jgi:hypothetical protein
MVFIELLILDGLPFRSDYDSINNISNLKVLYVDMRTLS